MWGWQEGAGPGYSRVSSECCSRVSPVSICWECFSASVFSIFSIFCCCLCRHICIDLLPLLFFGLKWFWTGDGSHGNMEIKLYRPTVRCSVEDSSVVWLSERLLVIKVLSQNLEWTILLAFFWTALIKSVWLINEVWWFRTPLSRWYHWLISSKRSFCRKSLFSVVMKFGERTGETRSVNGCKSPHLKQVSVRSQVFKILKNNTELNLMFNFRVDDSDYALCIFRENEMFGLMCSCPKKLPTEANDSEPDTDSSPLPWTTVHGLKLHWPVYICLQLLLSWSNSHNVHIQIQSIFIWLVLLYKSVVFSNVNSNRSFSSSNAMSPWT